MTSLEDLTSRAKQIWESGVAAVDSEKLIRSCVRVGGPKLLLGETPIDLTKIDRILVVGAGKAGAGMASGLEAALGPQWGDKLTGWVHVPADCVRPLDRIHLHAGRPAGVNEPTIEGVIGSRRMVQLLNEQTDRDLCIVLISGDGSALLPLPIDGVSLEDKLAVTRLLAESGATINELNCVRRHLSILKGGGLVAQTKARSIVSLIISDVVDDPLDVIASGPTVPETTNPIDAIHVLESLKDEVPESVLKALAANQTQLAPAPNVCRVNNHIIGNNRTALHACEKMAEELGYRVIELGSNNTGIASSVGVQLAEQALRVREEVRATGVPVCILSGGEPTVVLQSTDEPRKGGRNQELVLAAMVRLWDDSESIVVVSGGTDGEDGPTDAAGAIGSATTIRAAELLGLKPRDFLAANNSYPFFDATDGLLRTGPTHTNVMDIRVVLIDA